MSTLRISDAPLLPDVDGTEKIPTGGRGDYAISVDQIKGHIFQDVGKELVGLGNVDNTSDLDKPVSAAQQTALNLKADKTYVDANLNLKADKTNVYTRIETTLALSQKADLVNGVIPENQVPSSFNDVLEFTTPNLPIVGESGKIYITTDTNKTWRWGGNKYVEISGWNPDSVSKSVTLPTYLTKEAGVNPVTGVADDAYFNVRSTSDESYIDEYQNVGGSAVATGKSYPSAALVEDVKNNTAYFYPTVAQMIADTNLADGAVVATKGYHNIFDEGGAVYLISSVATDYSIPLANDLHAVFRDSFDIRKFGIVSSKTLDQTENLRRMIAYADSREYAIDFHSFDIVVPDIFQFRTSGRANMNCMGFNYLHEIKNLNLYHDQTKQLTPGKCMLGFYPKQNLNGVFKLKNVRFDAWSDNYTLNDPETGNRVGAGDGSMHGFSTFFHPEWTDFLDKTDVFYDISFDLSDIEFTSNAVSYNIEIARLAAKRTVLRNISGEYLALMVHFYTKDLYAENIHGVYRGDRIAGRLLVTNLLHCEPAIVAGKSLKMGTWYLENASAKRYDDGSLHDVIKYHAMGASTEIEKIHFKNIHGEFGTNASLDEGYTFLIKALIIEDSETTLAGVYDANYVELSNSKFSSNLIPRDYRWDRFKATNCELNALFYDTTASAVDQGDFEFIECRFTNSNGIGYSRPSSKWFNSIKAVGCTYSRNIIESGFSLLEVIGGEVSASAETIGDAIRATKVADGDTRPSEIYIDGVRSRKPQGAGTAFINGNSAPNRAISVLATNNVLVSKINRLGNSVVLKSINNVFSDTIVSVEYDPPSLAPSGTAGASTTTTVTVQGAALGDIVQAEFSQYNADIEISASVSSVNTVTVKFKNIGAAAVDLASGTLTVKLI